MVIASTAMLDAEATSIQFGLVMGLRAQLHSEKGNTKNQLDECQGQHGDDASVQDAYARTKPQFGNLKGCVCSLAHERPQAVFQAGAVHKHCLEIFQSLQKKRHKRHARAVSAQRAPVMVSRL
ncbi:MAG: hypothetical protein KBT18_12290 [Comamonas sp.]|nr:hypothetical protein [Candidatus Comamonas equi]